MPKVLSVPFFPDTVYYVLHFGNELHFSRIKSWGWSAIFALCCLTNSTPSRKTIPNGADVHEVNIKFRKSRLEKTNNLFLHSCEVINFQFWYWCMSYINIKVVNITILLREFWKFLKKCKTYSSRPRPWPRPRPKAQDHDGDFTTQDQDKDEDFFSVLGATRDQDLGPKDYITSPAVTTSDGITES